MFQCHMLQKSAERWLKKSRSSCGYGWSSCGDMTHRSRRAQDGRTFQCVNKRAVQLARWRVCLDLSPSDLIKITMTTTVCASSVGSQRCTVQRPTSAVAHLGGPPRLLFGCLCSPSHPTDIATDECGRPACVTPWRPRTASFRLPLFPKASN